MQHLSKKQLELLRSQFAKIVKMNDDELKEYKKVIDTSDGDIEVREILIEGIESRLNRKELTALALVEMSELTEGEIC